MQHWKTYSFDGLSKLTSNYSGYMWKSYISCLCLNKETYKSKDQSSVLAKPLGTKPGWWFTWHSLMESHRPQSEAWAPAQGPHRDPEVLREPINPLCSPPEQCHGQRSHTSQRLSHRRPPFPPDRHHSHAVPCLGAGRWWGRNLDEAAWI